MERGHKGRKWVAGAAVALAGAASACAGGQSGGEVQDRDPQITNIVACPCVIADRAVAVAATLEHADACEVRVVVDEVLGGASRAEVEVGQTLSGRPLDCGAAEPAAPGHTVLVLYAPDPPGPDGVDAGAERGASLYYTPLGAPIRIDIAGEDLPAGLDQALPLLLDFAACKQFADEHPLAMTNEETQAGGDDPDGLPPIDPDDPIVQVSGPAATDDEEAPFGCMP